MKNKDLLVVIIILIVIISFGSGYYFSMKSNEKTTTNDDSSVINNNSNRNQENAEQFDYSEYYYPDEIDIPNPFDEGKFFLENRSKLKVVFTKAEYEVLSTNCSVNNTNAELCPDRTNIDTYYVVDTTNNNYYYAMPALNYGRGYSKYYYNFLKYDDDGDKTFGIIDIKDNNIILGYDYYSCEFHSDSTINMCNNEVNTIVEKDGKKGVVLLKDSSLVLDVKYDNIAEDINGNFIVESNGKYGIFSSTGKALLDAKYDYIGLNEGIGYICITGEYVDYFDNKLNKKTFSLSELEKSYKKELDRKNKIELDNYNTHKENFSEPPEEEYVLDLANADSFYWSSGSILVKHNINEPFYTNSSEKEDGAYRFKYLGTRFSGEKFVIYSIYNACYKNNPVMYILDNDKAYKIDKKDIDPNISKDGSGAFCF